MPCLINSMTPCERRRAIDLPDEHLIEAVDWHTLREIQERWVDDHRFEIVDLFRHEFAEDWESGVKKLRQQLEAYQANEVRNRLGASL